MWWNWISWAFHLPAAIHRSDAYSVIAVSRRGTPPASEELTSWAYHDRMKWVSSVSSSLESAIEDNPEAVDAVVCSVGALLENESYKQVLERAENISPFLGRGDESSYTALNRDVCVNTIDTVEKHCVTNEQSITKAHPFVFISAHAAPLALMRDTSVRNERRKTTC